MRLLVIGKTGQLARAIAEQEPNATFLDRNACDLSKGPDHIRSALEGPLSDADAVIIAAAYTAVDQAETDVDTAHAVNAIAPSVIAELAAERNLPVVHISTDYVFQGNATEPYQPDAPTDPINVYGRTKRDGEVAIRQANPRSAILRTSWVYDASGKNFMTTMLRLAKDRNTVTVVNDQIGRPTYAADLAKAAILVAQNLQNGEDDASGIFHVSNAGLAISWADFARTIFEKAEAHGASPTTVVDIPSRDYPTPAKRPSYSVLDISDFETKLGMEMHAWEAGLDQALNRYFTNRPSD
ncbi:MAG: dTDP-4-dehydrorhamnose reductase [Pseudomonadota bacterium]